MAPKKRPLDASDANVLRCLADDVGLSRRSLSKIQRILGVQESAPQLLALNDFIEDCVTPYGPILKNLSLDVGEEKPLLWQVASPFALLYKLSDCNHRFMPFLHNHLKGGGRILLYTDETHPGNPLHFDEGLKVQCYYWTFNELPGWYRNWTHGWMPLGFFIYCRYEVVRGVCFSCSFSIHCFMHAPGGHVFLFMVSSTIICFWARSDGYHRLAWYRNM
jgi:hypothetical protein